MSKDDYRRKDELTRRHRENQKKSRDLIAAARKGQRQRMDYISGIPPTSEPAAPKRAKDDRTQRRSRAPEAVAPPRLAKLLPGTWQAQTTYTNGKMGQASVEMHPNGAFRTQGRSPMGMFLIEGMWQVTQPNQIALSGQQSDGFQVAPFNATIHFSQATANMLVGVLDTGEQLVYHRVR